MRASLSGWAVMANVSPDGPGPIRAHCRTIEPPEDGSTSNPTLPPTPPGLTTFHTHRRPGSTSTISQTVSHSPSASCRLRPLNQAPTATWSAPSSHSTSVSSGGYPRRQCDVGDVPPRGVGITRESLDRFNGGLIAITHLLASFVAAVVGFPSGGDRSSAASCDAVADSQSSPQADEDVGHHRQQDLADGVVERRKVAAEFKGDHSVDRTHSWGATVSGDPDRGGRDRSPQDAHRRRRGGSKPAGSCRSGPVLLTPRGASAGSCHALTDRTSGRRGAGWPEQSDATPTPWRRGRRRVIAGRRLEQGVAEVAGSPGRRRRRSIRVVRRDGGTPRWWTGPRSSATARTLIAVGPSAASRPGSCRHQLINGLFVVQTGSWFFPDGSRRSGCCLGGFGHGRDPCPQSLALRT